MRIHTTISSGLALAFVTAGCAMDPARIAIPPVASTTIVNPPAAAHVTDTTPTMILSIAGAVGILLAALASLALVLVAIKLFRKSTGLNALNVVNPIKES